jgi:hypothetical protein
MAMPHQTPSRTIDGDRVEEVSQELKRRIFRARGVLSEEIRSYPTPIPRCDAQFNHLVEQRDHLSRLLTDLDTAFDRSDGGVTLRVVLAKLRDLPNFGDSAEERGLRERIGAELDRT